MTYAVGAVKQDPDTLAVALRTTIDDCDKSWMIATVDRGGHYAAEAEVEHWLDLG